MKVESSIYVTILGIKFTIKEKHNKWHIAFNDSEGKRINRSMKLESSKKNLVVVKNDLLPQIAQELNSRKQSTITAVINSDDVILENISDIHFSLLKEKVRPHVYTRNFSNYHKHIVPYFKKRRLDSIKPMELESWQNRLLSKYKVTSVKKYRSIFYSIFTRAIQNELLIKNPFDNVPAPRDKNDFNLSEEDSVNPFTQKEIDILVNSDDDTYMPNFIKFMSNTGMRPGEIIALTWDDIDFEKRTINIDKTTVHGVDNLPKTVSSVRRIDMLKDAYSALKAQYELTGEYEYVFLNQSNKRFYSHDIVNVNLKKRLELLDIEDRSLYQFRHSFASRMISSGIDITWVSKMLGHKDVSITLQIYTKYLKEDEETRLSNLDKINEQLKNVA